MQKSCKHKQISSNCQQMSSHYFFTTCIRTQFFIQSCTRQTDKSTCWLDAKRYKFALCGCEDFALRSKPHDPKDLYTKKTPQYQTLAQCGSKKRPGERSVSKTWKHRDKDSVVSPEGCGKFGATSSSSTELLSSPIQI